MITWIPLTGPGSRMPTQEDASFRNEVVWLWADSIAMIARWDEALCDPQPVAWLPLPPYTPPKPGPTNEEISLLFIGARGNSWVDQDIRRWFADVTARIEREKQT